MLEEALIRGRGNLTAAAKTLGITRQAVQQMTYQFDLRTAVSTLRVQDADSPSAPKAAGVSAIVAHALYTSAGSPWGQSNGKRFP
jgi:hypothetical protein